MLILGFLGMYFDAAVVFVTNSSLLFRLALAILCFSSVAKNPTIFNIIEGEQKKSTQTFLSLEAIP